MIYAQMKLILIKLEIKVVEKQKKTKIVEKQQNVAILQQNENKKTKDKRKQKDKKKTKRQKETQLAAHSLVPTQIFMNLLKSLTERMKEEIEIKGYWISSHQPCFIL